MQRAPGSRRRRRRSVVFGLLLAIVVGCTLGKGPRTERLAPEHLLGFRHEAGEALLADLDCLACHAGNERTYARLRPLPAPDLDAIGARRPGDWMRRHLGDPHGGRDDARMPDLLAALDGDDRARTIEDLTAYLQSLGGPFVPTPELEQDWPVARGGELFHSVGCLACHTDELRDADLARSWDRAALAAFLVDPLSVWPSGRMPPMDLDEREADALASWLLRDRYADGPSQVVKAPGLRSDVYHFEDDLSDMPELLGRVPDRTLIAPVVQHEEDDVTDRYAVRQIGELFVPTTGNHTLYTSSDDGSWLRLDGETVVDNGGLHGDTVVTGEVFVEAGWHALEVTMFENTGGAALAAGWVRSAGEDDESYQPFETTQLRTPMVTYEPVDWQPLALDPDRVAAGRRRFERLNCQACHGVDGEPPRRQADAPALVDLRHLSDGCLAESVPAGLPDFRLRDEQRAALRAVLPAATALTQPLPPEVVVETTLERLQCLACHARDGRGGPRGAVAATFTSSADLGDEGRLPPDLTGVGAKLTRATLQDVLVGDSRVRPYMRARMPRFGGRAVAHLPRVLFTSDGGVGGHVALTDDTFDADQVEAGRRLVGRGGLSCISCHTTAGHPSIGLPGLDLAVMHDRLQPKWFERWMTEPLAMRSGTRMPTFFEEGRSIIEDELRGFASAQIEALWAYLALGEAMPLPAGVVVDHSEYAVVPVERPAYVGSFMAGLSARVLSVGFPEKLHVAFDMHNVRLGRLWTGEFFAAEGTWRGRAGKLEQPGGGTERDLPAGPAFAALDPATDDWPDADGKSAGWRMRGHTRDEDGLPTFHYSALDDDGEARLSVEESPSVQLAGSGPYLLRHFRVWSTVAGTELPVHRAAVAERIEPLAGSEAAFRTSDGLKIVVRGGYPEIRDGPDGQELLVLPPDIMPPRRWVLEVELRP